MNQHDSLLNPLEDKVKKGISLFVACMNRSENLEKALETWIQFKEIDEIVIVDWSSDVSLNKVVSRFQDERIIIARVPDQKHWILSHAFNLAARLTSKDKIFKIDADVKILPGFFQKHNLEKGMYYAGNWENHRNQNELYLNGMVFLSRSDFFKVNGYSEFIKSYGWDDDDLYGRLNASGLKRVDIDNDTLFHIEHENRAKHQELTHEKYNITNEEKLDLAILINQYLAFQNYRWRSNHKMFQFGCKIIGRNIIMCEQISPDINLVSSEDIIEAEKVALTRIMKRIGIDLKDNILDELNKEELLELYCYYHNNHIAINNLNKIIKQYNDYLDKIINT